MSRDVEIIDRIVANVLRKVEAAAPAAPQSHEQTSETRQSVDSPHTAEQVVRDAVFLDASVITADLLQQRVAGAAEITIGSRAVLTPSAREWLRDHGVRCRIKERLPHDALPDAEWCLLAGRAVAMCESVVAEAQRRGQPWSIEQVRDETEMLASALSMLRERPAGRIVALADEPEKFACRANRHAYVRAAVVRSDGDVRRVIRSMDVNVLVVRLEGMSFIGLRNVLRAYREHTATETEAGSTT